MPKTPQVSLILPTYNESENLPLLVKAIKKNLKKHLLEIIVVDDNSPDKTWQVALDLAKKFPLKLYRRLHERGLTSALNLGIKKSRGDYLGWQDADFSHPPKLLPIFLKNLKNYDAVVASRYVNRAQDKRINKKAVFFSLFLNRLAQLLLFQSFKDYTSGYILLKRKILKNYQLQGDYGEYFIKLIFDLKRRGFKVKEIPYICVDRQRGVSKTATNLLGFFQTGYKYPLMVFKLFLLRLKELPGKLF